MPVQFEQTIQTADIVPEYESRFYLVKKLFWSRINQALRFADIDKNRHYAILDVGVGAGKLLETIGKTFSNVDLHGTDFNLNIKKIFSEKLTLSDATKLPYKNNCFDVVFALDVLEHIQNVDAAIDEIRRVLKDEGVFIITAPTENFLQKFARFLLSGSASRKENKGSGMHYYNAKQLTAHISSKLTLVKKKGLPSFSPLPILKAMKFKKGKYENKL